MLDRSVATWVAERFGLGAGALLDGPVARGQVGQIWRLTTDRGRFAVKERFGTTSTVEAERDADYQDQLLAAGIPLPAVRRTVDGAVLAEVNGASVRVHDWVDLRAPDRRLDPADVAAVVAAIHEVVVPTDEEFDGWFVDPVGADQWFDVAARARSAMAPFADQLSAAVPSLIEVEELLASPGRTQLGHRDLWSDNVLSTIDGTVTVIDWEDCGPADPSQELGCVVFEFGCHEPARMRTLYASYLDAGGSGRLDAPGDLTMLIGQTNHIGHRHIERWLDVDDPAERTRRGLGVAELLDDPVTVETVQEILAAVAG